MIRSSFAVKKTYGGISTSVTKRPSQTPGLYRADCETNRVMRMKDVSLLVLPIWILGPIRRLGHEPQALASLTVPFGCEVSTLTCGVSVAFHSWERRSQERI
ncbi:hypothetical protein QAD02_021769 [Eretmocerus hayati]|uniref:Uncharacterized protein n=2 Tax=Eretmocerus hayati TaxID=131215 RepID=A0ACC2NLM2_9HYME|nr:hypothetical protein QAD02_003280 [Eretmocerus hayati]KAJ8685976.1 hypothetical protein QAD02_021769 [Eretmocerus hayati]